MPKYRPRFRITQPIKHPLENYSGLKSDPVSMPDVLAFRTRLSRAVCKTTEASRVLLGPQDVLWTVRRKRVAYEGIRKA